MALLKGFGLIEDIRAYSCTEGAIRRENKHKNRSSKYKFYCPTTSAIQLVVAKELSDFRPLISGLSDHTGLPGTGDVGR